MWFYIENAKCVRMHIGTQRLSMLTFQYVFLFQFLIDPPPPRKKT